MLKEHSSPLPRRVGTYANLDKVSKKSSSAQSATTPQALPTPRLQKQETMFLSSSSSNSCKNGLFPLPYGGWRPVTNSEISSNIISSNTLLKGSLKENSARRLTLPQQVTVTEDRYIWGGNRSAWANHSQTLLVHSFPWVQPWEAPPTGLVMKIGILLFTLCNPENQEDKDIFPLHSSLNPWVDQNSFPPPRVVGGGEVGMRGRTFLVVQWIQVHLPMQGTWVWSLVGELRSHMLWGN